MIKILFVCLGNICRSPMADAVFEQHVTNANLDFDIKIDSAGTGSWHLGEKPDSRAILMAAKRGYDLSKLRARQVCAQDFIEFDYILVMDESNYEDLKSLSPVKYQSKLNYFMSFAPHFKQLNIPDPYLDDRFEQVLNMVEAASQGLLDHLCNKA